MGQPRTGSNPTDTPARVFVTQAQAAARWGVHVDTIRRLVAAGKVTGYRLNHRVIRVSVAEVDACFRPIPSAKVG